MMDPDAKQCHRLLLVDELSLWQNATNKSLTINLLSSKAANSTNKSKDCSFLQDLKPNLYLFCSFVAEIVTNSSFIRKVAQLKKYANLQTNIIYKVKQFAN